MKPRIFSIPEARYFCSSFSSSKGLSESSLVNINDVLFKSQNRPIIQETNSDFISLRDCYLRDIERLLFFSMSQYRRCLDLMIASASPWALVTSYYGTFYAAKAILQMFGCVVFYKEIIDVDKGNIGNQALERRLFGNSNRNISTTFKGSHQRFWDVFYDAVIPLRNLISPKLSPALSPISFSRTWLSDNRNEINYDTCNSLNEVNIFISNFNSGSFPNCLSGSLSTQFRVMELMIEVAFYFSKFFNISTDALNTLQNNNPALSTKIIDFIYKEKTPRLIRKSKRPYR